MVQCTSLYYLSIKKPFLFFQGNGWGYWNPYQVHLIYLGCSPSKFKTHASASFILSTMYHWKINKLYFTFGKWLPDSTSSEGLVVLHRRYTHILFLTHIFDLVFFCSSIFMSYKSTVNAQPDTFHSKIWSSFLIEFKSSVGIDVCFLQLEYDMQKKTKRSV